MKKLFWLFSLIVIFCMTNIAHAIDGYQELEYIQSTGAQMINTGIYANENTKIETKFVNESSDSSTKIIIADAWTNPTYELSIVAYTRAFQYIGNLSITRTDYWTTGVVYTVSMDKNTGQTVNGSTTSWTGTSNTFTSTKPLTMFGVTDASNRYAYARVYYLKIWQNGTLVRDFVPVRRNTDNVVGMYDKENGVFYTNIGSGTFSPGPVKTDPGVITLTWDNESTTSCTYGGTFVPPTPAPRSGYIFVGWKIKNTGLDFGTINTSDNGTKRWSKGVYNNADYCWYDTDTGSATHVECNNDSNFSELLQSEWKVLYPHGQLYGIAGCSPNAGTNRYPGAPTIGTGSQCWCKATGYKATNQNEIKKSAYTLSWLFATTYDSDATCARNCGASCALSVELWETWRVAIYTPASD